MAIELLTPEELAKLASLHTRTIVRLAQDGTLPGIKFGGRWRFQKKDIENYLDVQAGHHHHRILVVDDDRAILDVLERVIASMGHTAVLANSGKEALECLAGEDQISLVVLDLLMPGITGLEILKHLNNRKIKVPVMIFTGQVDSEYFEKALRYQFVTVVLKPADSASLKMALGMLLSGVKAFKETA